MTEQEKEDKKEEIRMYMQLLEQECYIDSNKEVDYPPLALSVGTHTVSTREGKKEYPIRLGTLGNFSFISAPPKSKKTFFTSLLSAVYLKGELNGIGGDLRGHRDGKCLVHFDTEQGVWDCVRTFKRVRQMTGLNEDCYHTYGLRSLSYQERIEFIEYILFDKMGGENIGLVIIDGAADLVSEVNNLPESNLVSQKLMTWSKRLNCHITTVMHSNFGSFKATGHLGSILTKKCETEIQLELNTVNTDLVTVICKESRGVNFENFSFKVNDYGIPVVQGGFYDILKPNTF